MNRRESRCHGTNGHIGAARKHRPIASAGRQLVPRALAAVALTVLVSCAPAMAPRADTGLGGTAWLVEGLAPDSAAESFRQTLVFVDDEQINGEGGCNSFFGTYRTDGARLTIGPLGSTRMACPGPLMDAEDRLFAALEAVAEWRRDGEDVLLVDGDGRTLARLTPIADGP